jgi:superfamily II DNA or RNA helicase
MACGSGKTLVGRWVAEQHDPPFTLVMLPSLQLVAQTLAEWCRPGSWPFRAIVVCSDPTTTAGVAERSNADEAAAAAAWRTSQVPVTTDPRVVAAFLDAQAEDPAARTVVFGTYHSAPVVAAAIRIATPAVRFGLAVLDEAHHLAGCPSSAFRTVLDDNAIPVDRRLFLTATPVGAEPRPAAAAAPRPRHPVLSMNDQSVFGPVLHRLPFGQAISEGQLCDYRVLVIGVRSQAAAARRGILPLPVTLAALQDAVARYGLRRVLTFHNRVASAEQFARHAAAAGGWTPGLRVWAAPVTGSMPAGRRRMLLGRLEAVRGDTAGIITSARCLGEGVDVPAVDGLLFADPRSSVVDIVQAAGRALRPAPGKEVGTIIIPVALPAGSDDDEETLLDTPFAHVWTVLRALRAHDERLAADLDTLSRTATAPHGPGGPGRGQALAGGRLQFSLPAGVPLPAVRLRLIRNTGSRWERMFGLLETYAAAHGHTRTTSSTVLAGEQVGTWAALQRSHYRKRLLDPARAARLAALPGWRWTTAEIADDQTLERLTRHITAIGTAKQPPSGPSIYAGVCDSQGRPLGAWVAGRRQAWRRGTLAQDTAAQLAALPDWDWRPMPAGDLAMVDALAAFTAREGHGNPPANHIEHRPATTALPLGEWILDVRRRALTGTLHPALEEEIMAATPLPSHAGRRFTWDIYETRWLLSLQALTVYANREHHTDVPPDHTEELDGTAIELGTWCATQRQLYHRGELTPARGRQLTALPRWTWGKPPAQPTASPPAPASHPAHRAKHGTPIRFDQGCRCVPCAIARQRYDDAAALATAGEDPAAVTAARARRRLQELHQCHVPLSRAAAATGATTTRLQQIQDGLVAQITPAEDAAIAVLDVTALTCGQERRTRAPSPLEQERWRHRYNLLARWTSQHRHAAIPPSLVIDGINLRTWVGEQRQQWKRGRIPAERAALLEKLPGWAWDPLAQAWGAAFTRLQEFAAAHGHTLVPQNYQAPDGFYLGSWVHRQRAERAAGKLLPANAARLESLAGWAWDTSHSAAFEAGLAALHRYATEHGHAAPPAQHTDSSGFKLGRWVSNHRHRRPDLTPAERASLEALPGWDWDPFETRWQAAYRSLTQFAARTGHACVPPDHAEPAPTAGAPTPLGRWVAQQRADYSRDTVSPERQRLLEAVPGWIWDGYEARRRRAGLVTQQPG